MITVKHFGNTPVSMDMTIKEELLMAASAYGLSYGQSIHRFSLFGFVQTHLSPRSEESLQGTIEKDKENWYMEGKGVYSLTTTGAIKMYNYQAFPLLSLRSVFIFESYFDDNVIKLVCSPREKKCYCYLNNKRTKPTNVIDLLVDAGFGPFYVVRGSEVLKWIIDTKYYSWKIEY